MAQLIDGRKIARSINGAVMEAASAFQKRSGKTVGLAVVIVGDDPASHTYVAAKSRMAKECGFNSIQHTLPKETTQEELVNLVAQLNADSAIHGILVQLPLPKHLKSDGVIQSILPEKDVDGLNVVNAGKVATGDVTTGLVSCTPAGAMVMIKRIHGADLSGLSAVVIGRSNLFGRPMGQLLLNANATVTMAHSRTKDLPTICKDADILVAAIGQPEMVKQDWVKPGATVIDVGINRTSDTDREQGKNRLVGDVDFDAAEKIAGAITPVPGGVGPMTIAMLMANTVKSAWRAEGLAAPSLGGT